MVKNRNLFCQQIKINENYKQNRLEMIFQQYEKGIIREEDISKDDKEKIVAMYEKETEKLNYDTMKRMENMQKMLKEIRTVKK